MSSGRYDAFISYNHAVDGRLAEALRRGLQGFARPWNRRRAMRVFLDRSSLEVTSDIGDALRSRLDAADHLVLLASRESAASRWCDEEVRHWLATKGPATLLIVLTDADGAIDWDDEHGRFDPEATNVLPPSLFEAVDEEPLWLDLSWADGDDHAALALRNPVFGDAVATLASAITGTPKDELEGEDVRQHRTFVRLRAAAVTGLVLFAVAAAVMTVVAILNENAAQANAREARSRELAVRALAIPDSDPEVAVLTAVEAMYPSGVDRDALASGSGETEEAEHALGVVLRRLVSGGAPPLERIDTPATALAVAPDGASLAAGSPWSPVTRFDLRSGATIRVPGEPEPPAGVIRFNADGTWIVAVGPDVRPDAGVPSDWWKLTSWDVSSGAVSTDEVTTNAVTEPNARSVTLSADGRFTYGAVDTDLLRLDNASPKLDADLGFDSRLPVTVSRRGDWAIAETLPLSGGWLLLVGHDGATELLPPEPEVDGGGASSLVEAELDWAPVVGVAASSDGSVVAIETVVGARRLVTVAAFADGTFSIRSETEIERPDGTGAPTSGSIAVADTGAVALLDGHPSDEPHPDGVVVLIDGEVVDVVAAPTAMTVEWLPARPVVALGSPWAVWFEVVSGSVGFDPRVPVGEWNAAPEPVWPDDLGAPRTGFGADATTTAVAVGDGAVLGFENGNIRRYDRDGRLAERLPSPHRSAVTSIALDDDASVMTSSAVRATEDGAVVEFVVWDTATWSVLEHRTSMSETATIDVRSDASFSDDGRRVIVTGGEIVEVWPHVDAVLACELVTDESIRRFEADVLGGERSACRRADVREF